MGLLLVPSRPGAWERAVHFACLSPSAGLHPVPDAAAAVGTPGGGGAAAAAAAAAAANNGTHHDRQRCQKKASAVPSAFNRVGMVTSWEAKQQGVLALALAGCLALLVTRVNAQKNRNHQVALQLWDFPLTLPGWSSCMHKKHVNANVWRPLHETQAEPSCMRACPGRLAAPQRGRRCRYAPARMSPAPCDCAARAPADQCSAAAQEGCFSSTTHAPRPRHVHWPQTTNKSLRAPRGHFRCRRRDSLPFQGNRRRPLSCSPGSASSKSHPRGASVAAALPAGVMEPDVQLRNCQYARPPRGRRRPRATAAVAGEYLMEPSTRDAT